MTYKLVTVEQHPRQFLHVQEHNKEQTINVLLLTCDAVKIYAITETLLEMREKPIPILKQVHPPSGN